MSTSLALSGKCLCEKVSITLTPKSTEIGACHCATCRQWSGSAFLAVESEQVSLSGDSISRYDSSVWAERGFCNQCGTHLFYKLKSHNTYYVPVGLLAEHPDMALTHQIFIDSKPSYYNFAEQTSCMTGAEVFAAFGGE